MVGRREFLFQFLAVPLAGLALPPVEEDLDPELALCDEWGVPLCTEAGELIGG
jgi:hypothetical protein